MEEIIQTAVLPLLPTYSRARTCYLSLPSTASPVFLSCCSVHVQYNSCHAVLSDSVSRYLVNTQKALVSPCYPEPGEKLWESRFQLTCSDTAWPANVQATVPSRVQQPHVLNWVSREGFSQDPIKAGVRETVRSAPH